jgi:prevent-host-death family protein
MRLTAGEGMTTLVIMSRHARAPSFSWPLAKAKAHLSELVNAALAGTPQIITRHGEDAVVVMATKQYAETVAWRVSIAEFFAQSPLAGVDLAVERNRSESRPIDL